MQRRSFLNKSIFIFTSGIYSGFLTPSLFANSKFEDFRAVDIKDATLLQDGESKNFCSVCGMSLNMFYKTNHAARVNNQEKEHQYCSIHCMCQDVMTNKYSLQEPKVVDVTSLKFINAKEATYVYGSSKPATMSSISSYAFKDRADAIKFKDEFGGKILNFEEVFNKTKESLKDDIKLIEKRQKMAAMRGKKIFEASCTKDVKDRFSTPADAKAYILNNNICPNLTPKELSEVAHYLTKK